MIRRIFPRFSLVIVLVAIGLIAAACGSAGTPNGYADQVREFTDEAGNTDERSVTEANYRSGCEAANEAAGVAGGEEYCKCTFDVFALNVPFAVFKEYDKRVADGVENGTVRTTDDIYEEFQEAYDSLLDEEGETTIAEFQAAMKDLEDQSSDTRALEELLSDCV